MIGNGFDLAHGLPTGYCDFIKDYWNTLAHKIFGPGASRKYSDGLVNFDCDYHGGLCTSSSEWKKESWAEIDDFLKHDGYKSVIAFESNLFMWINQAIQMENWVDVENEYYGFLKGIFINTKYSKRLYDDPKKLNSDLGTIKNKLVDYLKKINDQITPELVQYPIRDIIYGQINVDDISVNGRGVFEQWLAERWTMLRSEADVDMFMQKYNDSDAKIILSSNTFYKKSTKSLEEHKRKIFQKGCLIPLCYLLPDQILLLNFNYTKTANQYRSFNQLCKVNHIHGELGNDNNPIIFGYGDELDEDYKSIANLNDNEYLKNIKSIRYLETDNYRQLLRFIDSAPYQIYVMGHSCGNSDRTLLNTLFEHRNCLSIKPYYHKKADGTDNYIDIVQNISRDFNDMTLMRDRVVNKGYCRPLVEPTH